MAHPPSAPDSPLPDPLPPLPPLLLQRVPTGIPGLDTILYGGFWRTGLYLIAGPPGTGKTILSNQIAVHHVTRGGRVVFASLLSETYTRMFAHLSSLAFFSAPILAQFIGDALHRPVKQARGPHNLDYSLAFAGRCVPHSASRGYTETPPTGTRHSRAVPPPARPPPA